MNRLTILSSIFCVMSLFATTEEEVAQGYYYDSNGNLYYDDYTYDTYVEQPWYGPGYYYNNIWFNSYGDWYGHHHRHHGDRHGGGA